ncbi:MAG TPA: Wzz/FepE/Etk N-terminal domain-containing protein [Lapillicoccus sp.]
MAERTADVSTAVAGLRRRWHIVVAAALVGLGLGVLYAFLVPVQLSSKSLIYVSGGTGSSGDAADTAVDTQVKIVESTPVLEKAGRSLKPALSAQQVLDRITVDAPTSQLIEIKASSPRPREAEALSKGVAEAYVESIVARAKAVTGATMGDLYVRRDRLESTLKHVSDQLQQTTDRLEAASTSSPGQGRDTTLKAELTVQQAGLAADLERVQSDIAAGGGVEGASTAATIVQAGVPAIGPGRLPALVTWGALGALLGAAFAAAFVAFRARRDPRLRARDDLADAVGSTVLVDLRSRPQRSVAEWSTLFETYDAPPVDAWAFRQMLRALVTSLEPARVGRTRTSRGGRLEHPRSVTVIALAGDRRGLAVAPQLATFAASLGIRTRFVVATGHDLAASLWAACSAERASELRAGLQLESRAADPVVTPVPPQSLAQSADALAEIMDALVEIMEEAVPGSVPDADDEDDEEPAVNAMSRLTPLPDALTAFAAASKHPAPDLTVVLAVVDGKQPKLDAVAPTAATVLAVAPGVGTREDLARLAVAVDDAGRRIDGIVVADPDASDRTTGRRTLEERARQATLPVRMTGSGQGPASMGEPG